MTRRREIQDSQTPVAQHHTAILAPPKAGCVRPAMRQTVAQTDE
jgi:hypothetical protein